MTGVMASIDSRTQLVGQNRLELGGLKEQVQQSVNFSALAKRTQSRFQNIIINGRLTEPSRSACTRFSLPKAYPMTSSSVAETAAIHNPPFIA